MKTYWVYILASARNGTLYIGVTSDLIRRIFQHKEAAIDSFTKEHNVHCLVYFEQHISIEHAITREKQIKKWNRDWKLALIERDNPNWEDLYESICA